MSPRFLQTSASTVLDDRAPPPAVSVISSTTPQRRLVLLASVIPNLDLVQKSFPHTLSSSPVVSKYPSNSGPLFRTQLVGRRFRQTLSIPVSTLRPLHGFSVGLARLRFLKTISSLDQTSTSRFSRLFRGF
ncbi:hypothetical protein LINPERHAP1_LOCUS19363 [Linum perenne]